MFSLSLVCVWLSSILELSTLHFMAVGFVLSFMRFLIIGLFFCFCYIYFFFFT